MTAIKKPCGCCGTASRALASADAEYNRPGLPALAYRIGTYATFRARMLERLSSIAIATPDGDRLYPLKQLTTRQASDPSIALLDAWAVLADVLTFYQERIAHEGYLITATERRSVVELARLIGYRARPGVSASVFLAFTVSNGFDGEIPVGTRAQSIPGTGERAQYFETSVVLPARDVWNDLGPRLSRPQVISPPPDPDLQIDNHLGTNADIADSVFFQGIGTNLKAGDALLLVLSDDPDQQFLRVAERVDLQPDDKRTRVALREAPLAPSGNAEAVVRGFVQRFIEDAPNQFAGSDLAAQAAALLRHVVDAAAGASGTGDSGVAALTAAREIVAPIQTLHDVAVNRQFTRVEVWLQHVVDLLPLLTSTLLEFTGGESEAPIRATPSFAVSSLERLTALLPAIARPVSAPPLNPARLARSTASSFAAHADTMPRLIAALNPVAAPILYAAWGKVQPEHIQLRTYALRAKAGLFASNYPGASTFNTNTQVASFTPASIANAWGDLLTRGMTSLAVIALDATYDKIVADSWIAVSQPNFDVDADPTVDRRTSYHKVTDVQTVALDTTTGYAAKVTVLTLASSWVTVPGNKATDFRRLIEKPFLLRGTTVYAQAEPLDLSEVPLDRDVAGDSIELDGLYDGLEPGRWIIVSGERTDIPNVTGVKSSELAMISGVTQGAGKESCLAFLPKVIPFESLFYISDANADGDRLVVGIPSTDLRRTLAQIPLPPPGGSNQQFCEGVQLCPGVYADAYVPTAAERTGNFAAFADQLVDPDSVEGSPAPDLFPGGVIPADRLDTIFAWRVRRLLSGSETVHTTIQLANALNYTYDSQKVSLYANVVKATHGQTTGEVLGDGDASQAFQTLTLHQQPLTYVSAATPAGAESTLVVRVNEIAWGEADALIAQGPRDRSYVTQTDDQDRTSVIFGNGEHGARVPTGSANIKATYRYGIGRAGNVNAWQISQLATHPLGLQGVVNPLPAGGGADRDSLDQVRRNAPLAVTALDRLVSVQDYADFARTYAGIGKASAVRLSDGRTQLVHLTVAGSVGADVGARDIALDPGSELYRNLVTALQTFGDPFQPVQVCSCKVTLLVISTAVRLEPGYAWESVEPRVRAALLAGFNVETRELGQPAFLSEALAMMQSVAGVASVEPVAFDAVSDDTTAEQLLQLATTLTVRPYVRAEYAHLDPAAAADADPCVRIRPADLVFLAPDLPATLILTEIGA